jgi:subtilisin family serine protease
MRELAEKGILVIFAAGNSGAGTAQVNSPASSEHVVACAAVNKSFEPATFTSSGSGSKPNTSGPGVNIQSLAPGGRYADMSGTSMACPHLSGVTGLFVQACDAAGAKVPTVYEYVALLKSRSTDTHTPGVDRRTGPGWYTPELFATYLTPDAPPPAGS